MQRTVGIIGVGELGRAIVEGLCEKTAEPPTIWLSPRGSAASADLAARYPNATVCRDNPEVAERSDLLVLAVRKDQLRDALADVTIAPGTVVISALAGVTIADLQALLGDRCTVVRSIPMPAVRSGGSVTVIHPADETTAALFAPLGGTLVATDEVQLSAFSASTATVSSFMQYLATIVDWLTERGVQADEADRYLRGVFGGAVGALADSTRPIAEIAADHETPGGLNEQLRTTWFDPSASDLRRGLDALFARARGS